MRGGFWATSFFRVVMFHRCRSVRTYATVNASGAASCLRSVRHRPHRFHELAVRHAGRTQSNAMNVGEGRSIVERL